MAAVLTSVCLRDLGLASVCSLQDLGLGMFAGTCVRFVYRNLAQYVKIYGNFTEVLAAVSLRELGRGMFAGPWSRYVNIR